MRILFIAIASLFLTTPAAAQELSTREKVVLGGAQSALDGCKIMTKNILSFDTSIANCAGFKKSLDEKYPDDTPYNRAIKMIYLTAIDAEIARLHLLWAEPDLAGCEVVHGAIERYAGFAEFFEDTDGLAALGQSSTERLMRYLKKCPKAKIEQTFVASFGSLALELDRATTPCWKPKPSPCLLILTPI